MDLLSLGAGIILAVVFAVAGVAKLADRPGTRTAIEAFGVPRALVAPAALLVPLAELGVAVLLLVPGAGAAGAAGALVLLTVLSAAVAVSMVRGRAPECHCFGQLHSKPAGWTTLARNAALAALGAVALAVDPARVGGTAILVATVVIVAGGAAGAGLLGFLALLRSHGRLLLRLDVLERALAQAGIEVEAQEPELPELGLAPGTMAPAFAALDDLLAPGLPLLLVFTSPDCGPCRTLVPRLAAWQRDYGDRLTIALVSTGDEAAEHVILDGDFALYGRYEANGTPSAVLVSAEGTIASFVASGPDAIERLVDDVLAAPDQDARANGLALGAPVPDVSLSGLDGERVALVDPQRMSLVLFWNPGCGFCGSMLDDLRAWERGAPATAPRLLVVSSGDADATRADGLSSQVALDPDMLVGAAFEANGTPMAVLVDGEGRVASPLAAGAAAVLALAGPVAERGGRQAT